MSETLLVNQFKFMCFVKDVRTHHALKKLFISIFDHCNVINYERNQVL
jgi:hypothetical protein